MSRPRLLLAAALALAAAAFFAFGGHRYLTFENVKQQQAAIEAYYQSHPWQTVLGYFAFYVVVTAVSLPGAAVMTLVGGAVFGLLWGTVIVSFASSIGATLAFLSARFLLRDWVQQRFGPALRAINAGVEKDGGFYLFTLRLIPAQTHARVFELLYSDLSSMLADQRRLIAGERFDRISGCIRPSPRGRWFYYIQAECNFTPPNEPDKEILPAELHHLSGFERLYTLPYFDCVVRNPRFTAIRGSGEVELPHPWLNIFLPDSVIDQYLAETFGTLTPADIGIDFPVTFFFIKTGICTHPLLRLPEEASGFLFHLMGTLPDQESAARMIDRFRGFFEKARELGGKQYPINSLPFSREDWQEHFHPYWEQFVDAKHRFDPDNILTPGPGIF